uniref:C2H2-type domain-containing protein n=1 Tax=Parastrongyloides trichosuri TaxID=131310 RepID=A0A0N5A230_PARTI
MPISGKEPHKKIQFISPMVRVSNLRNNSKELLKKRCIECGEIFENTVKYQEHLVVHDLINLCYTMISDEKVTGRSIPQLVSGVIEGYTSYTKKIVIKEVLLKDGVLSIKWQNPDPFYIKNIQLEFLQFVNSTNLNTMNKKHEWCLLSKDAKEFKKSLEYGYDYLLSIVFIDYENKWFAHGISYVSNY